jgi:crossover junction endodeoxyribonuclease RuvC
MDTMMKEEQTVYCGFDPGKDGAAAFLGGGEVYVVPFDKARYIQALLLFQHEGYKIRAVVEHVGAMPGQGVTSCFSFGESFGWLQGVLDAIGVSYELVRPQRWKKEFGCTKDKNTSIAVAKRLFPDVSLRRTERCTKDHDGMAEALLMACFAFRKMGGTVHGA